ncbi:linear amide C-N hydrolase [uncultured Desulfosarcina sp.]|uniref:linear amide C-N hydrolase n=1 Tax=uncultured Desulfosarcina sp. TaxID=218289 RepID=UPI0029C6F101|nr:linear amide C-N hydrolase [uncultured Desulfosarcina sp.]
MKYFSIILVGCILILAFSSSGADACSGFQLKHSGQIFVGKNYDYMVPDCLVMVNKRGLKKTAMPYFWSDDNPDIGTPASWTAKYGSITFNQYGREVPAGGMNEKGLVVESTGLFGAGKYPAPDKRPSILMWQWIQYQLDNFATVQEVMDSDAFIRIRPKKGIRNHYFVSDKAGNCAVVEFIGGEKVYHLNEKLPYKVLTNDIYTESVDFYHQNKIPNPDRFKSIERFIRAANMVKAFDAGNGTGPLDYAFDILKSVSWSVTRERKGVTYTSGTRWSIVYDPIHLRIYFKTFDNQKVRSIRLDAFDFACAAPARIFEINARTSGDVTEKFADYTRTANLDLIKNAFDKTIFLPKMKDEVLDRLAQYPASFTCQE